MNENELNENIRPAGWRPGDWFHGAGLTHYLAVACTRASRVRGFIFRRVRILFSKRPKNPAAGFFVPVREKKNPNTAPAGRPREKNILTRPRAAGRAAKNPAAGFFVLAREKENPITAPASRPREKISYHRPRRAGRMKNPAAGFFAQ